MNSILTISEPKRISAEEFAERYAGDRVELIDGIVTELPMPTSEHGWLCFQIAFALGNFIVPNDLGRILTNDSFVRTKVNPERVRGADIAYYSFAKLPKGTIPAIPDVAPDIVVEVLSPSDTWTELFAKVTEYLNADVTVVLVIDPTTETVCSFRANQEQDVVGRGQTLTIPDVLPGFTVPVDRLFN